MIEAGMVSGTPEKSGSLPSALARAPPLCVIKCNQIAQCTHAFSMHPNNHAISIAEYEGAVD